MEKAFIIFLGIYFTAIAIEVIYGIKRQQKLYHIKDTLVSFFLGISGAVLRVVFKGFWLWLWMFFYEITPLKIPQNVFTWILLFFCNELVYYWFHRLSHEKRFLWAVHVNHHSSEFLNFSTAARTPFFNLIFHNLFWIPLVLVGFDPVMILAVETISFLFAFLQHTQIIKNYSYLDFILNTPLHHRIHHASNPPYINKNYGNVLIVFDRIFGTFQNETEGVSIRYGIIGNIRSYNLVTVIFHEWVSMFKDWKGRSNR